MKRKIVCSVLLMLALLLNPFASFAPTLRAGDGILQEGLPLVEEPVEYEIAARTAKNKDFKELEYFQKLEEKTNVIIHWNMSSTDGWPEKKSLLFGSNALPDAFYGQHILTDVDIIKYGSNGTLIPLNDLIDAHAPNLKALLDADPQYRAIITAPDGNIYSLPTINELSPTTHDKWFINRCWLEKLNLDPPETWEALKETLIAFKENDMNDNGDASDEIPFTFRMSATDPFNRQQGLQSLFGTFGQLDDIYHFVLDEDEVVYTPITDAYKDALRAFHELYELGLLDPEAFTHDANVYVSKIQDPNKTVGMWLGWSRSATAAANKEEYMPLKPLKGEDGRQLWRRVDSKVLSRGSFSITEGTPNPEVLIAWIDQSYDPVTSLEICQGLIGRTLEETEDGKFRHMELPEGVVLDTMIHDFSPGNNGTFALMQPTIDRLILNANLEERRDLDAFYEPYNGTDAYSYPNVFFTEEEIEQISMLQTDINAFVSQKYSSWIVNGGIDEEWDDYVKRLDAMQLQDYIAIYETAYQRYKELK